MLNLALRDVQPGDLPIFFEYNRDPMAVTMAAFTAKDPDDRAAFDAHWARILAEPSGSIQTVVVDGQVAGSVLSYLDGDRREVGYWIGRAFWGQGVATAALRAYLNWDARRPLFARVAKDNLASLHVLQKCGFAITGEDRGFAEARGEEIEEYILALDARGSH